MEINLILMIRPHIVNRFMSLGENSLVAAYQGRGQLKSRPSGTRVVTRIFLSFKIIGRTPIHETSVLELTMRQIVIYTVILYITLVQSNCSTNTIMSIYNNEPCIVLY